jgi:prepilin-type processing-associated H-X9-DG protein
LTELLVVVALAGIVASLMIPSVQRGADAARSAEDVARLRQLSAVLLSYGQENEGQLPRMWSGSGTYTWLARLVAFQDGMTVGQANAKIVSEKPNRRQFYRSPYHDFSKPAIWQSYGLNDWLASPQWDYRLTAVSGCLSKIILVCGMEQAAYESVATSDGQTLWGAKSHWPKPAFRHAGKSAAHAAFFDGHVEALDAAALELRPEGRQELSRWVPWWR